LRDEGFEVVVKGAFLLIYNIPYVNSTREIKFGTLVSTLTIAGDSATRPDNHVAYFIGDQPCNKDGTIITALLHQQNKSILAEGIEVDRSFSNKPQEGYTDYYQKMTTYINIICGPALSLDETITAKTFKLVISDEKETEFKYPDTNSSRAGIGMISEKLKKQKIGIIGIGGTGSYLLDFISKCPVEEIHLYDNDDFLLHNAFRSPGAPEAESLIKRPKKTQYFKDIYSNMHSNIIVHTENITPMNLIELQNLDFVFICIDTSYLKKDILEFLNVKKISFIDVGIGIERTDKNSLIGLIRITSGIKGGIDHIISNGRITFADGQEDNEYHQNIQIAELNALNAALAVIKWKKILGFYYDAGNENHSIYSIDDNSIINDDFAT
jgi:hypothetical protein